MPYTSPPRQIALFLYGSPAGSPLSKTSFFIDDNTGQMWYYPDNIAINHVGLGFTHNATVEWIPGKIWYSITAGKKIGVATFDDDPLPTTSITLATSSDFYIAYRDDLDRVQDLALSCVGIYNEEYTPALSKRHGRVRKF